MRKDLDRLGDMLEAIEAIARYTTSGRDRFDSDELVRVWCLRHIELIGEAASRLSEELRAKHSNVPWRKIIGMRNALIHGYFKINWPRVWNTIEKDLPDLRSALQSIIESEK